MLSKKVSPPAFSLFISCAFRPFLFCLGHQFGRIPLDMAAGHPEMKKVLEQAAEDLANAESALSSGGSTPRELAVALTVVPARRLASTGALSDLAFEKLGRFVRSSRADQQACFAAFFSWRAGEGGGRGSRKPRGQQPQARPSQVEPAVH